MKYNVTAVIGLGLIGGSLALALKKSGYNGLIKGYDACENTLQEAYTAGAIDVIAKSIQVAVEDADLVIIAVPIGGYEEVLKTMNPSLKPGAVVTDVGSVKGYISEMAQKHLTGDIYFIGGHPMAGSEKSGISAANYLLFKNAYYFLVPEKNVPDEIIESLFEIVGLLGAKPVIISAREHDKIVSRISHLPQFAAVSLTNMLCGEEYSRFLDFAAGGFKDTTRIASGSPGLWADILLSNKEEVLQCITEFENKCSELKAALEYNDRKQVMELLASAKTVRDSIIKL